ncbi:hypothetical protein [Streptomyces sp. NPDC002057]|uniref:hypothetical protein n=1 Tax=Streptomyces sp. NPDC002057 TaxID=3154664 RepID=UPI00332F1118
MSTHQHNPASMPDPAQQPTAPAVPPQQPTGAGPDPKPWTTGQIVHSGLTALQLLAVGGLILRQAPGMVPVVDALGSLAGGLGGIVVMFLTLRSARRR